MVGIIYRSPTQNSFLQILNKSFGSIETDAKVTCSWWFHKNMYENNKYKYMVYLNNTVCTKFTSADAKKVSSVLYSARLEATNSMPNSSNLYHNENKAIFPLLCYPS